MSSDYDPGKFFTGSSIQPDIPLPTSCQCTSANPCSSQLSWAAKKVLDFNSGWLQKLPTYSATPTQSACLESIECPRRKVLAHFVLSGLATVPGVTWSSAQADDIRQEMMNLGALYTDLSDICSNTANSFVIAKEAAIPRHPSEPAPKFSHRDTAKVLYYLAKNPYFKDNLNARSVAHFVIHNEELTATDKLSITSDVLEK